MRKQGLWAGAGAGALRRRGRRKRRELTRPAAVHSRCEKTSVPQPKKRAAAKVPVEYDEESEEEARPARSASQRPLLYAFHASRP